MAELGRADSLEILRWLVEAGADEAILDTPVDRLAERPNSAPGSRAGTREPAVFQRPATAARSAVTKMAAGAAAVSLGTAPGAARALAASCTNLAELKAAVEIVRRLRTEKERDQHGICRRLARGPRHADRRSARRGRRPPRLAVRRAGGTIARTACSRPSGSTAAGAYITNVLMWRPPQNRDPSPEEAAICLPFLSRGTSNWPIPRCLFFSVRFPCITCSASPTASCAPRGRWNVYQGAGRTIPAMPTLHPAYLLRQPSAKRLAWRDLLAVREKLDEPGVI